jgi:hypothetical protein
LLAALKEQTIFQSTDDLKFGKAPDLCQVVVIHK